MADNSVLISNSSMQDTLEFLLGRLLETGEVESIFALRGTKQEGRYCYSLISDPALVNEILPFYPVMPVQGARALSELTITEPLDRPVAALLRPCEIRAFVENVKQSQGNLESIFIISCTCPGVIPARELLTENRENVLKNHDEHKRSACKVCTEFIPGPQADMTVLIASDKPQDGTVIYLQTERAAEIAEKLDSYKLEIGLPPDELTSEILKTRRKALKQLLGTTPAVAEGLQSLVSIFSACTGCRGCREVCPLCSCILCDYETARTIHSPGLVRSESKLRGSLRVPSGTIQFQLGRLMHIAPLCIACGQCSDVCPVDIPVSDIFIRAGNLVQESLNYSPGREVDDTPPMATYVENELLDITD
ncbi:MAG: 4Fe-4S dicluster domain-containing protein [Candidatus Aegiribacteria sp.]|nr:4Fe-4S dicluster domain-containing protein [Candidatus Aegiribacteria sp.]